MTRTVAIVGRPNVGKSALFNRLTGKQLSIVYDQPGTTRDRLIATVKRRGHQFTLIDTGGIGLEDAEGFGDAIEREAGLALDTATDILLVVDAREGLSPLDRDVADRLRAASCPVHVVANKVDVPEKFANWEAEFSALGFGNAFPVSATHGNGFDNLLDCVMGPWGKAPEQETPATPVGFQRPVNIAIVGRPNVGKSSLINALTGEGRAIVSDVAGTTRDALDARFTHHEQDYVLVDTAGMRQKRRIEDALESKMAGRAAHSINRADICVLVIDAETGVTGQDKKIAGLIANAYRPCVVVVNKWDLRRDAGVGGKSAERDAYEGVLADLFFLNYAPVLFMSAKTGERVNGVMKFVEKVVANLQQRLPAGPLNRLLGNIFQKRQPPSTGSKRLKLLYAAQKVEDDPGEHPVPTLQLFVNHPKLMTAPYRRYLEAQVRKEYDLLGCPLKFIMRGREKAGAPERAPRPHKQRSKPGRRGPRK